MAEAIATRRRAAFYRRFIPDGSLCFDIGANIGNRVAPLLAIGAVVVAVEPQRQCAAELLRKFERNGRFILVEKALGAAEGSATMLVPQASTIATLSPDFASATQRSGRFTEYSWDHEEEIAVTTFDALISKYGIPAFSKIDVEGYEAEVLAGLSHSVPCLSFEYTPEIIEVAVRCIERLATLGTYEYNLCRGESMAWALPRWADSEKMRSILVAEGYPSWGDVYARKVKSLTGEQA